MCTGSDVQKLWLRRAEHFFRGHYRSESTSKRWQRDLHALEHSDGDETGCCIVSVLWAWQGGN